MNILLHMPHVSLEVPDEFYEGLTISKTLFNKYNLEMTDLGIDILFKDLNCIKIIPKYSRLYCDVERFLDDDMEIMSKYGQGVIYTHTYDGLLFHNHDDDYKNRVIKYYNEKILNKIIDKIKEMGYSYQINYPYNGSLVPNCIYTKEIKGNICSIMLEINKRIYL